MFPKSIEFAWINRRVRRGDSIFWTWRKKKEYGRVWGAIKQKEVSETKTRLPRRNHRGTLTNPEIRDARSRGRARIFRNKQREWKAGSRERERETRGEKQFGSARGRGRRTSNGATKLILQNAAFRSGKLLRSTSWRVRPCFRGRRRRGVNRFAAVSSRVTTVPNRDAAWSPRKFRPRGLSRGERGKILHGGRVQLFLPSPVIREKAAQ